jgi:hypothetical protein
VKKIVLVTSLYRLRKHHACQPRYDYLVSQLGPKWGDKKSINLLDILKHNGTADCLWALCAVVKHPEGDRVMRLMAADFAEAALPIYEKEYPDDKRPRLAIKAARDFANGKITDKERAAARDAACAAARDAACAAAGAAACAAARDAAWDAARDAAWGAAWSAARGAAWSAARGAARDAAWGAAWSAARGAARDEQAKVIRKYLGAGKSK